MKTFLIILLIVFSLILLWFVVAVIKEMRRQKSIEDIFVDKAVDNIMGYREKASGTPKRKTKPRGPRKPKRTPIDKPENTTSVEENTDGLDERFDEVARFVVSEQTAQRQNIQRKQAMGYHHVGCILDQLEKAGIVGPENERGEREVRVTDTESLEQILSRYAGFPRYQMVGQEKKTLDDLYWKEMKAEDE